MVLRNLSSTCLLYTSPKLILSEYYDKYFYMEDRAIERLTDLKDFWMPFVDDTTTYPIDLSLIHICTARGR